MKALLSILTISVVLFLISGNVRADEGHSGYRAVSTGKSREQVRAELIQAEKTGLTFTRSRDYPLDAPRTTQPAEVLEVQVAG